MRTKQPEKMNEHLWNRARTILPERFDRRGSENQRWVLAKPDRVFRHGQRVADARQFTAQSLQQAHSPEKIKSVRLAFKLLDQRIWRLPICGGHRMISPRC